MLRLHLFLAAAAFAALGDRQFEAPTTLPLASVPQFVVIGSDDNGSGIDTLVQIASEFKNADGTPVLFSFYSNSSPSMYPDMVAMHQQAWAAGHEMALHTRTHPSLWGEDSASIASEIRLNRQDLAKVYGVSESWNPGFRSPFLEWDKRVLREVLKQGMPYDCSVEDGFDPNLGPRNYAWPYDLRIALDSSFPATKVAAPSAEVTTWEIPVYPLQVPPDSVAARYGAYAGLLDTLDQRYPVAKAKALGGKLVGFDYNSWVQFQTTPEEFLAILKYNLDERLLGNRNPMTLGIHAPNYDQDSGHAWALRQFIAYAVSRPEVRVVAARDLLSWMKSPKALAVRPVASAVDGSYHAYDIHGRLMWSGAYPAHGWSAVLPAGLWFVRDPAGVSHLRHIE